MLLQGNSIIQGFQYILNEENNALQKLKKYGEKPISKRLSHCNTSKEIELYFKDVSKLDHTNS